MGKITCIEAYFVRLDGLSGVLRNYLCQVMSTWFNPLLTRVTAVVEELDWEGGFFMEEDLEYVTGSEAKDSLSPDRTMTIVYSSNRFYGYLHVPRQSH